MAKVLPLRIWLYSVVLVAAVMAVAALYYRSARQEAGAAAAGQVQHFLADHPDRPGVRVVALGSSLLWAATPPGQYEKLEGMDWLRITKSGSSMGYLHAVLDVLDRHPPGILVIDTNLLLPTTPDVILEEMRYAVATMLKAQVAKLVARGGPGTATGMRLNDQVTMFPCEVQTPAAIRKQLASLVAQQNSAQGRPDIDAALQARLLQLSRRGVHIVVLEIRRSNHFEQALTHERQSWLQRWKAAMPPGPRVSYLASPDYPEPDLYCDGRHMNAAGARRFETWWSAQLQSMAKGG
ncbi:hypothetical protein [Duganella sp. Leaf61]|uniref:hypothetical protein n=1 Tax=Duganella sp. Leaf61 TaxID=1736227 RepID=UPI0012E26DF6|nr:hypothetical protein [Duganella sp. Leaf61]